VPSRRRHRRDHVRPSAWGVSGDAVEARASATAASRRYVRVKRKNTTVFLNVEKSDSFGGIKAKLAEILGADAEKIHLYTSRDESTETVDTAFVDNFCESDVVVYMKMDGDKGIEVDEPPKPSA
jgi:hypothetical protein